MRIVLFVCVHNSGPSRMAESECVLSFPIKDLNTIAHSLEQLNDKAIPSVRGKVIYKALLNKEISPRGVS